MTGESGLENQALGVCYQVTLDFCNVPPYPTLQSPAHLSSRYLQ